MPIGPIARLSADSLGQLENLLKNNGLPIEDVGERADIFCGILDVARLVAAGGLEPAGNFGLLRSVVVQPEYRDQGLAQAIVEFLLGQAQLQGREAVYLLTETAAGYFENLGFSRVERAQVPAAIAQTRQFAALCPDSASCLMTALAPG